MLKVKTLKTLEFDKVLHRLKDFAVSKTGAERLSELKPAVERGEVETLLQETDEAVQVLLSNGPIPLEGFYDLTFILKKAHMDSVLSMRELLDVAATLRVIRDVKKYFGEINVEGCVILSDLADGIVELNHLEKEITRCVISEDELSDRASSQLFHLRRQIRNKNQSIKDKLNSMITTTAYQNYLQDRIITIRQNRYVIPVKQEYRSDIPGIIHDQSSTGSTLFIEPTAIVQLNNELKKLKLEEEAEVKRILKDLTSRVSEHYEVLSNDIEALIKLDVIFAKGSYALSINAVKPAINEELEFNLKKARHPLIHPDKVVASDIYLGKNCNTMIITGPNTGGKTVVLKTVGLISLMAQSGLFIPANHNSSVCLYREIFADIGDEQSIEQSLSTFSSHMSNIVDILDSVKEDSLVLLDELGAGTDPTEGAALAMSIIDYLANKRINTIVTTHYSELKEYAIVKDNVENASVEFDVNTLKPTYRLIIGIPGKSNAFEISRSLGLREDIIESSRKYLTNERIQFEDILSDIQKKSKVTDERFYEATKKNELAEELLKEIELEREEIKKLKRQANLKAKEEALEIIESAKKEAQKIIAEMNSVKRSCKDGSIRNLEELRRGLNERGALLEKELIQNRKSRVKRERPLKLGDKVLIQSLNQKGYILELYDAEALVEVGIMKTKVSLDDLIHVEEKQSKSASFSRKGLNGKAKTVKSSIDIRGMTADEAAIDVEKFIDDAVLANLSQITIIHGKGTGVLRQTVQGILKSNGRVKSFKSGAFNEGGTGVTVVSLE